MMIVIIVTIWLHAREARGACRAARFVFRELRPRAKRSLERDALRRIVIHIFCGDDFIGGIVCFDPSIESREGVIRGIGGIWPVDPLTEGICAGSATAMAIPGTMKRR